jgi:uncharacterized membrane protein YhaH (DUF805 family)
VGHDPGQFPTPPAAGWHADPTGRHEYRYHDGAVWTDHVADQGQPAQDPLLPPNPPPVAMPPGGQPWASVQGSAASRPSWENPGPPSNPAWPGPGASAPQPGGWGTPPNVTTGDGRRRPTPPGGVTFGEAVQRVLSKYVDFTGRAPRSEYWWWVLALVGAAFAVSFVVAIFTGDPDVADGLVGLLWLGTILPSLAVGVRRLHDTDRSGWWLLIGLVPLVGGIVLIVLMATEGSRHPNRYGPPVSS